MNTTEICETYVLPLIMAFGVGVIAADIAHERRDLAALHTAGRAIDAAEFYARACSQPWPPAQLAELVEEGAR